MTLSEAEASIARHSAVNTTESDSAGVRPDEGNGVHGSESGRVIRTLTALSSRQVAGWITTAVALAFIPRYLGAQDFGLFSTVVAITSYVSILAGSGLHAVIVRRAALRPESLGTDLLSAVGARLLVAGVVAPAGFVIGTAIIDRPVGRIILAAFLTAAAVDLVTGLLAGALQGRHRIGLLSGLTFAIATCGEFAVVLALSRGAGLIAQAIVTPIVAVLALATTAWVFAREARPVHVSFRSLRPGVLDMYRAGAPFLAFDIANRVFGYVDVLLLAALTSPSVVGWYTFAWRLSGVAAVPANLAGSALLPTLTVAAERDHAYLRSGLRNALRLVAAVCVPASAGLAVLAPQIVALVTGEITFAPAAQVMQVLSPALSLAALNVVLGTAVQAIGKQRQLALVSWGAAVVNICSNVVVIPLAQANWANGGVGAAITTLETELYMSSWLVFLLRDRIRVSLVLSSLMRPVAATVFMTGVVYYVAPQVPLSATIAVGTVSYGLAALMLRVLEPADLRSLVNAFRVPGAAV